MMKAIVFDMDGLMVDSERLYFQAQREIARQFKKKIPDKTLWKMMGRKPLESLNIFKNELNIPVSVEDILKLRNRIMREKLENDLVPMPGLDHIIHSFYNRVKLAISTGAQQEFLDIIVNKLGIKDKFDVLQSSDEIKVGKPHPEIYLTTCKKLNIKPEKCIILEDSSNGVQSGKQAGCYVIAVPSKYTKYQDFSNADFIANDLFHAEVHIHQTFAFPTIV